MRISNLVSKRSGERLRLEAAFQWEDSDRPAKVVYFETAQAGDLAAIDPNIFVIVGYPVATAHGERRLSLDGPVSPLLCERLNDVHAWWRQWGLADGRPPPIEAPRADSGSSGDPRSVAFLSGGVDSLHMLQRNLTTFSPGDRHRIRECIVIHGSDLWFDHNAGQSSDDLADAGLNRIAGDAGVTLRHVTTNIRQLDKRLKFWVSMFHGAALSATAHAAIEGPGTVRIAATYDVPNMAAWGSHPLIDPNYSTERLSFIHEGVAYSRLDKVRGLGAWPIALQNMRVCTMQLAGRINCGVCEKCVRTKLEIVAAGLTIPLSFANRRLAPESLHEITNDYQASCYRDVIAPLEANDRQILAASIRHKLWAYGARRTSQIARRAARNALRRTLVGLPDARRLYSRLAAAGSTHSRLINGAPS